MYKSAILGCRGRARGHARAYEHVKKGKPVRYLRYERRPAQRFR